MHEVHYYIPTRGRVDDQSTLRNLPKFLHRFCTLVCPATEEYDLRSRWPEVRVVAQPPAIQTIGQKREWIFKNLVLNDEVAFAWQLDDDLIFKTLDERKLFRMSERVPDLTAQWFLETEPALRAKFPVLGLGTSYFAQKGGYRENYHLGFAWGMRSDAIARLEMGRLDVFEDIDFTLQMLRKGFRIAVCYDVVVDQKAPDAPGGVTGERNAETILRDVKKLIKYHDEFVALKERRPGAHPAAITKVMWKRAAKAGGLI